MIFSITGSKHETQEYTIERLPRTVDLTGEIQTFIDTAAEEKEGQA